MNRMPRISWVAKTSTETGYKKLTPQDHSHEAKDILIIALDASV